MGSGAKYILISLDFHNSPVSLLPYHIDEDTIERELKALCFSLRSGGFEPYIWYLRCFCCLLEGA